MSAASTRAWYQTPRFIVLTTVLTVASATVAKHQFTTAGAARAATVASLDSAIATALVTDGDSSSAVRALAYRRRDAAIEARRTDWGWGTIFVVSAGIAVAGVLEAFERLAFYVRGRLRKRAPR